ncbi:MAG: efflux RND transporter periplasmic adaptor subunit, partial [Candidatus Omnitrophica bacterium]|nr:efflux RND transporter periplasmic adaptor subunit [Candidatus Omnitrophota bacterium]
GVFLLAKMFSSCSPAKDSLQAVRAVKVTRGDLSVTVTATGTVKPYNRVEIKAPIPGRIEEVLVQEGEEVKMGQVLARMSSVERAALLDAARAQGDAAVKRWQEAYKIAPLLAPLDGMIIVRSVEPGQTVTTADPVVVLSDRLIVEALVDETDLAMIQLGQRTEIRLDAYPKEVFEGKVDHITFESKLENNVNVYAIDILPEKVPESFRSGMTANVTFIAKEKKDILLVPSEAVMEWPKSIPNPMGAQFAVYKKEFGGKLEPVPVKIGESDGRMTEITDGLKEGAEVVVVRKKEKKQSTNPFGPGGAPKKTGGQKNS